MYETDFLDKNKDGQYVLQRVEYFREKYYSKFYASNKIFFKYINKIDRKQKRNRKKSPLQ